MKHILFRELSEIDLEATIVCDWLKDVGDYWSGVVSGVVSVFKPTKK